MLARSMLRTRFAPFLAGILLASSCMTSVRAAEHPVLERVVMATSGVGWLSFTGQTDQGGHVLLELPAGQLDDALKSLTVSGGTPDAELKLKQVRIGGRGVLADPFQDSPLRLEDLSSLGLLLERMRGARVTIDDDPPLAGRIVGVETRQAGEDGAVVPRTVLILSTVDGLTSIDLDESVRVQFDDPQAERALATVLERTTQTRNDERRTLDIATDAQAGTPLAMGLLVETPVWKPTWRLLLGDQGARIQGWAVVENRTGQDWSGVQLTLVDGDADTLRQELTRTWFVERPTVPVVPGRDVQPFLANRSSGLAKSAASFAAAPLAADMMMDEVQQAFTPMNVVEASSTEADLATTFSIEAPVDVADDGSLMVPLLDRSLPVKRIAFVPEGGSGGAPQSAIRLTNDTGTTLPRGIVTVMDTGAGAAPVHVGDAMLPLLPEGAERRLSFGLDRKISYALTEDNTQKISALTLADGVLTLTIAQRQERRWTFKSDDDAARSLEVAARVLMGSTAVTPADPERDGEVWLVRGTLLARGETSLELVTERPVEQRFTITTEETLDTILVSQGLTMPEAWRPKLSEITRLAGRRADADRRLTQLGQERSAVLADQNRVRENLEAVREAGPLRERWLSELSRQEDQLATMADERVRVTAERDEAASGLRSLVTELRQ